MQTNTGRFGIRGKLISIFIVIKVVPLVLLALLAWTMAEKLGDAVGLQLESVSSSMLRTLRSVGEEATQDALHALDDRARESMERLTTDTARAVAAFLYDRDADIREAAELEPGDASYRRFLAHRQRPVFSHGPWKLADDGKRWEPAAPESWDESLAADAGQALSDNAKAFSARPPEFLGHREMRPLFVEMSFIDLSGRERVKVTQGSLMTPGLRQVSDARETFIRAEHYWPELQKLKPGEIHVSDVVGAYVKSHVIGPYLPASAEKAGEPFKPEASAYAGTENPVGRRFRGIVRWAMPVVRQGQITGYVTLALDHDHIRQFTDRISPTDARYTPINDAIAGNYAFMWDHRGRAISHPRDYFIPGYDPATGEPVTPWMDQSLYEAWQSSGKSSQAFLEGVKPYDDQSLKKKPAGALVKAGTVALDCRYLNFSPQCSGWKLLTEKGGSGSFVIFFSGLWKLTTAAAIPYYTGPYAASPQGFGIVTIGANVDDFHRAATESAKRIGLTIDAKDKEFQTLRAGISQAINDNLTQTAGALAISTLVMVAVVIAVAIWMAQFITRRITRMIEGLDGFQAGDLSRRLEVKSTDEMGHLAESFNSMADRVQESFKRSEDARQSAEAANRMKSEFLANISHELRTPLNGILGFAELLKLDATDAAHQEYAATIESSGQHLLDLVNDLLDLAKVEAGRMELNLNDVPLATFAQEVCAAHRGHAQAKGLQLECTIAAGTPERLHTDPLRLRQILNNLLNNAIKFTDNGRIDLNIHADGERIALAVSDTGRGIPKDAQDVIFDKFRQVDAFVTREQAGTGLGLALARQFVHLLGGELSLRSEPGVGSTFTLLLPRDAATTARPTASPR